MSARAHDPGQNAGPMPANDPAPHPGGRLRYSLVLTAKLLVPPALILALGAAIYHPLLWVPINPEDCGWIQGNDYGFPNRLIQVTLLSRWIPAWRSDLFEPFYVVVLGLHMLTALLIYALFLQLVSTVRCRFPHGPIARHVGAAAGALLFLCYQAVNLVYLSSISYQLVTVSTLLALIFTLIFLRRRHPLLWLPVLAAKVLAVLAHTYGMGLVAFIGLTELFWRRSTPACPPPGRWWIRYGLLGLIMVGQLVMYYPIYLRQVDYFGWGQGDPLADPLRLGRYLGLAVLDLARHTQLAIRHDYTLFASSSTELPLPAGLILLAALALAGLAMVQLLRRRPLDIPGMVLLFILAWGGMAFLVNRRAPGWDSYMWRYYFNAAGLCLVAPFAYLSAASRLTGRRRGWRADLPAWLLLGLMIALPARGLQDRFHALKAVVKSERWVRNLHSCRARISCQSVTRLTRDQVKQAAKAGRALSCVDLSGLDLSGLDLSGADLRKADLSWAMLAGTRLDRARLNGACLNWATVKGATFKGTDLREASLAGTVLLHLDLTTALFHEPDAHCHLARKVKWPPGLPP